MTDVRRIIRSLVAGEVSGVGTQLDIQYFYHLELDEEVGIYVEVWHWQGTLAAGMLVGNHILPVENTELEVLLQLRCNQIDGVAALHWCHCHACAQTIFCNRILL